MPALGRARLADQEEVGPAEEVAALTRGRTRRHTIGPDPPFAILAYCV